MLINVKRRARLVSVLLGMCAAAAPLVAQTVPNYWTGEVMMLEAWTTGSVAFTLATPNPPCGQQFVVNGTHPGAKNFYAMLLTAKATGRTVKAYVGACGTIDNGTFSYAHVTYLYLN
jgi:hypothetical protein